MPTRDQSPQKTSVPQLGDLDSIKVVTGSSHPRTGDCKKYIVGVRYETIM